MSKFFTFGVGFIYLTLVSFTLFEKKIGEDSHYNEGYSAVPFDDGILISGSYNEFGPYQFWKSHVLFLSYSGDTIWQKMNSGLNGFAKPTLDGNVIFFGGNFAGMLYDSIRISMADKKGNLLWMKQFKLQGCSNTINDIIETKDGFIIVGNVAKGSCSQSNFDGFVMKIDKIGNEIWYQEYHGDFEDQFHQVKMLSNGNIVVAGWTNSLSSNHLADMLVVVYDSLGGFIKENTFGDDKNNYAYGLEIVNDGSIILNGYSDVMEVLKVSSDLKLIWKKELHASCGSIYYRVNATKDGGLGLLGTESLNGNCVSVFYKLSSNGDVIWKKSFDGIIRSFSETADSAFVMVGFADYLPDMYVVLFDSIRIVQTNIKKPDFGGVNIQHRDDFEINDILEQLGIITRVDEKALEEKYSSVKVYPNPAHESITISFKNDAQLQYSLEIYDFTGKIVMQKNNITNTEIQIRKDWLSNGVYTYKLSGGETLHCGKFIFN